MKAVNAVGYVRVSTLEQAKEGVSLDTTVIYIFWRMWKSACYRWRKVVQLLAKSIIKRSCYEWPVGFLFCTGNRCVDEEVGW